jgi:glycosyltransferase involved in cell wall biosynthesis
MRKFVRQCFPRLVASVPDVRLTIVGAYPSWAIRNVASDRIRVTGHVPDVRPFLERAEVFVAPLNSGGGTRLKILEAIAMGTPVVSTSIGCEGLRLRDGEHILVADSPESFVQAVLRLFRDPELRAGLAARALDTVRRLYGWDHAGENLLRAYESLRVPQGRGDRIGVGSRA